MKFSKKTTILITSLVLILSLSLFSCGKSDTEDTSKNIEASQAEDTADKEKSSSDKSNKSDKSDKAIKGWPSENSIAKNIPTCSVGDIANVTEEQSSIYIMVNDVSREDALDYWDQAEKAGYTDVVSKSDTGSSGGFTYVANSSENISLSVTWSPGSGKGTLTVLAIQL